MKTLNRKTIIRICNLACIALTALLIILQFIPFLYNVDGHILTKAEYEQMQAIGSNVPGFEQTADRITKHVSVAEAVWSDNTETMAMVHIGILLFGIIGMIISFQNRHSTLSGIFPLVVAYSGLGEALALGTIFHITGIVSMLIAPFALVLCGCHVWKMITWCTVEDEKYRSMWGLR